MIASEEKVLAVRNTIRGRVTGEVLKTNCYIKTLQSAMGRQ